METVDDEPAVGHVEPRARWRGVLREFATIVAGVLVALAGQAWWEHQQDRDREQSYLRQLLADSWINERQTSAAIRSDRHVERALGAAATALYAPRPLPPPDSLRTLFGGDLFSSSNLELRTGTLSALLNSGDIRLVHTDSLRAALVAYAAAQQNDAELFRLFYEQAFSDPGRLARVLPFARRFFVTLTDAEERALRGREGLLLSAMRDDPQLAAILFSLQSANSNRLAHLRMQLGRTMRLRKMLERELIG